MSAAKCPHCGGLLTDLYEYWPDAHGMDDWSEDAECGWCEKPFTITCSVSIDYAIVELDIATQERQSCAKDGGT